MDKRSSKPRRLGVELRHALLRIEELEKRQRAIIGWIDQWSSTEVQVGGMDPPNQKVIKQMLKEERHRHG